MWAVKAVEFRDDGSCFCEQLRTQEIVIIMWAVKAVKFRDDGSSCFCEQLRTQEIAIITWAVKAVKFRDDGSCLCEQLRTQEIVIIMWAVKAVKFRDGGSSCFCEQLRTQEIAIIMWAVKAVKFRDDGSSCFCEQLRTQEIAIIMWAVKAVKFRDDGSYFFEQLRTHRRSSSSREKLKVICKCISHNVWLKDEMPDKLQSQHFDNWFLLWFPNFWSNASLAILHTTYMTELNTSCTVLVRTVMQRCELYAACDVAYLDMPPVEIS